VENNYLNMSGALVIKGGFLEKYNLLSILIPAYNEEKTIIPLLNKVAKVKLPVEKELIIINNNSKDNTDKLVTNWIKKNKSVPAKQIFETRAGKGAAVRAGMKAAKGDLLIMQDADMEYDPADYVELLKPILSGKTKVVYGNRLGYSENRSAHLSFYFGGRLMTQLANLIFCANIKDVNVCYKLWDAKLTKGVRFNEDGFAFDFAEITPFFLKKLRKEGLKIVNIPIHYYPRSVEEGKKIKWKDGVYGICAMIKYKFFW